MLPPSLSSADWGSLLFFSSWSFSSPLHFQLHLGDIQLLCKDEGVAASQDSLQKRNCRKLLVWKEAGPWKQGASVLDAGQPVSLYCRAGEIKGNLYKILISTLSDQLSELLPPSCLLLPVFLMHRLHSNIIIIIMNSVVFNREQFCFSGDIWSPTEVTFREWRPGVLLIAL